MLNAQDQHLSKEYMGENIKKGENNMNAFQKY